jgi:hypothetical protein
MVMVSSVRKAVAAQVTARKQTMSWVDLVGLIAPTLIALLSWKGGTLELKISISKRPHRAKPRKPKKQ